MSAAAEFAEQLTAWLSRTSIDPATIAKVTIERHPDGFLLGFDLHASDGGFRFTNPPRGDPSSE